MELQCKERVDLLEALRQSRMDNTGGDASVDDQGGKLQKSSSKVPETSRPSRQSLDNEREEKGFIGNGTIPAVNYPDISRPPPLPQRPSLFSKNSSERAVIGVKSPQYQSSYASSSRTPTPSTSSTLAPPPKKTSRSPSPEKGRTMLHTLRSDRGARRSGNKPSRPSREDPVTSKAASLAWQSLGKSGKDSLGRSLDSDVVNSSATLADRRDSRDDRPSSSHNVRYDSKTRTLVHDGISQSASPSDGSAGKSDLLDVSGRSTAYPFPPTDPGQSGILSSSTPTPSTLKDSVDSDIPFAESSSSRTRRSSPPPAPPKHLGKLEPVSYPTYLKEYPETSAKQRSSTELPVRRKPVVAKDGGVRSSENYSSSSRRSAAANISSPRHRDKHQIRDDERRSHRRQTSRVKEEDTTTGSEGNEDHASKLRRQQIRKQKQKQKQAEDPILADPITPSSDSESSPIDVVKSAWEIKAAQLLKNLPKGVDEAAAKQIVNEIVVQGDEVHWSDVAGLDVAKNALKEAVVYPFLRPDLFMGLREPARGMLLFGPPGTGKTMLARAVATESKSTFFSISASSLTSKYLGESEKLVRALFSLARALAPSIIFVDEIDSLLSSRTGGEHEATRRIKTEFLIQWSDLQRAAAGREQSEKEKEKGDASRVLVLAATNLPWAIDEAARRRFVRRQYIPLPEGETRAVQLRTLLGHQKHSLEESDIQHLVSLTEGQFKFLHSLETNKC